MGFSGAAPTRLAVLRRSLSLASSGPSPSLGCARRSPPNRVLARSGLRALRGRPTPRVCCGECLTAKTPSTPSAPEILDFASRFVSTTLFSFLLSKRYPDERRRQFQGAEPKALVPKKILGALGGLGALGANTPHVFGTLCRQLKILTRRLEPAFDALTTITA